VKSVHSINLIAEIVLNIENPSSYISLKRNRVLKIDPLDQIKCAQRKDERNLSVRDQMNKSSPNGNKNEVE
jgi:hypothetical protein